MSRKIQIVLSDLQAAQLAELAANTGERQSTLAGLFVRTGIAQAAKDGMVRQLRQAPIIVGGGGDRARWLEPYRKMGPGRRATHPHDQSERLTGYGQTTGQRVLRALRLEPQSWGNEAHGPRAPPLRSLSCVDRSLAIGPLETSRARLELL